MAPFPEMEPLYGDNYVHIIYLKIESCIFMLRWGEMKQRTCNLQVSFLKERGTMNNEVQEEYLKGFHLNPEFK